MSVPAAELLRAGLLEGTFVLVACAPADEAPAEGAAADGAPAEGSPAEGPPAEREAGLGAAVEEACSGLGALLHVCVLDSVEEAIIDETVGAALGEREGLDMLVVDCAGMFTRGGLPACLDSAWNVTRAVVNLAFLPTGRGGRIVYLAPPPGAGEHAGAALAGLENLSRTLSIEWARHGITLVTVAPGEGTSAGEVGALVAYLASPAGAYFSGCLLDLRGARA